MQRASAGVRPVVSVSTMNKFMGSIKQLVHKTAQGLNSSACAWLRWLSRL
jgi:pyruvate/2-oxoglutarate/acetoin dehydrogenase E1 component